MHLVLQVLAVGGGGANSGRHQAAGAGECPLRHAWHQQTGACLLLQAGVIPAHPRLYLEGARNLEASAETVESAETEGDSGERGETERTHS